MIYIVVFLLIVVLMIAAFAFIWGLLKLQFENQNGDTIIVLEIFKFIKLKIHTKAKRKKNNKK